MASALPGFSHLRCFRITKGLNGKTLFQARADPFAESWVDLHGNVDGHIPLCLKPLTFKNVFGDNASMDGLAYTAHKLKNFENIAKMQHNVRYCPFYWLSMK